MNKKLIFGITALFASAALLAGCGAMGDAGTSYFPEGGLDFVADACDPNAPDSQLPNYQYGSVIEQGYQKAEKASYLSLDRNTAGYSLVRAQIASGVKIASDSVRTEELYNYFTYAYPAPEEGEALRATTYLTDCPWNAGRKLLTVGIRSQERVLESERNNYVFLVDVSGSMSARVAGTDKSCLGLAKHGILTMLEGLGERDSVSLVTYASGVETKLEPTLCTERGKEEIVRKVNALTASGSTNGEGGLQLAYRNAETYKSEDGNNRVILMTDGDFNVGMHSVDALKEFIQEKAKSGVYLSVLGFGMGNMRDDLMQTLALNGNGNYLYIDSEREAEKALGEELNGVLVTVAKDAKAGIAFNTEAVAEYRVIGYDMKILSEDDFNNAQTDAGEIGSNLCVTAVYELVLQEGVAEGAELATVTLRYKTADTGEDREITAAACNALSQSQDALFVSCVAEFGLVLRASAYRGDASLASVAARLQGLAEYTAADGNKAEFVQLVQKAIQSEFYPD